MPSLVTPPRTCRVPVAPSHHPHPTFQTQPVGAQEPLDEGILLGVFVAGTREPVTIPDELPERVFQASGGKSVTGSDFDPASLPCPGERRYPLRRIKLQPSLLYPALPLAQVCGSWL